MRTLTILLLAVTTAACSATRSRGLDYAETPGADPIAAAADEAVVVFLRPGFTGHEFTAVVYEGEEFLSFVMTDSHYVHRTTPGPHRYAVVSESADFLDAELAPGKVHFVEVRPRFGVWRARFNLFPIHAAGEQYDELTTWMAESFAVLPNERAREWDRNNHDSAMGKCADKLPEWLQKDDRPVLSADDGLTAFPRD